MIVKPRKVYLQWRDSRAFVGTAWANSEDVEELEKRGLGMTSVGYIVAEKKGKKGHIVISASVSDDGSCSNPMVIPREAIVKLRRIQ
jgi:hypothetical protein